MRIPVIKSTLSNLHYVIIGQKVIVYILPSLNKENVFCNVYV